MRSYVPAPGGWLSPLAASRRAELDRAAAGLERRGGVAGLVLFGQDGGEPRPGTLQPLQADGGEALAPLPELERFLQGEPSALQPPDHLDELVARLLVGHLRGGGAVTGLAAGVLVAGTLLGRRPAARGAATALRLTRLGGHGANLAGCRPAMPGVARRAPGPHALRGSEAVAGPVARTAAATTPAYRRAPAGRGCTPSPQSRPVRGA